MAGLFSSVEEKRKRNSRLADAMLMQGIDTSPVQHWTQGLSRIAQALTGGYLGHLADEDAKGETKKLAALMIPPGLREKAPAAPPASPTAAERPEQPMWTAPGIPGVLPGAQAPTPQQDAGTWHTRQNNPGNIRMTDTSLKAYPGAQPGQNGFLAFQTPEQGLAAIAQTFRHIAKTRGVNTLAGIISVYAPKGDGANDPLAYATAISRETGIPVDAPLNLDDPATIQKIIPALIRVETGKASPYTPQQLASVGRSQTPGASPPAQPSQVAQAPATTATDGIPEHEAAYIKQLVDSGEPSLIEMGVKRYLELTAPGKPTDDIREYQMAVRQGYKGSLQDWIIAQKKAGATAVTVDTKGETKFAEAVGKHQAERFDKIVTGGADAKSMIANIQALRDIGSRITTGKTAQLKEALGPYAEMFGVKIDGLDDLQAYQAIVSRLAPQMRVPGSGATSDFEMQQFLKALPSLGRTPGGNELISRTLDALAEHKVAAAEIASRAMAGEITPREAEKQLRALPDPLELWKKTRGKEGPIDSKGSGKKEFQFNPSTGRIE